MALAGAGVERGRLFLPKAGLVVLVWTGIASALKRISALFSAF